jgi:single-strand DNA-binding protein
MADNTITVIGNVTRDPELRYTGGSQTVTTFGVAVNRRWQNRQSQEWEESTSFFDIVCWGTLAENVADSLSKGTRVLITGRLEQRSWETQEGEKRSKIEIVADEVGPSLRWAIARAEKVDRRNGQGGGYQGGGGGGGGSRSGSQGGSGGGGFEGRQGGGGGGGYQGGGSNRGGGDAGYESPVPSGGGFEEEEPF